MTGGVGCTIANWSGLVSENPEGSVYENSNFVGVELTGPERSV
jgi:hypothetical protein